MKRHLAAVFIFFLLFFWGDAVWALGTEELMGEMDFSEIGKFLEGADGAAGEVAFEDLVRGSLQNILSSNKKGNSKWN